MSRRQLVQEMVSAGGVVYRDTNDGLEVVICGRNYPAIWALPKGTPEPGESSQETAVREVAVRRARPRADEQRGVVHARSRAVAAAAEFG